MIYPLIVEGQSLTGYERKKCGIKFNWLKEIQKNKLKLLIENYIVKSFENEY